MPEICRFKGIKIRMHFGAHEHPPAHFHAQSGNGAAMIDFDGKLLQGFLPPGELALVRRWAKLRQAELLQNWELCQRDNAPFKIEPLG